MTKKYEFDVEHQLQNLFNEISMPLNEDYIRTQYTQRGRYYHSLYHITDMYHLHHTMYDTMGVDFGKYNNDILKAILFHDIIYDATRKDNEDRSADVYLEYSVKKM